MTMEEALNQPPFNKFHRLKPNEGSQHADCSMLTGYYVVHLLMSPTK